MTQRITKVIMMQFAYVVPKQAGKRTGLPLTFLFQLWFI